MKLFHENNNTALNPPTQEGRVEGIKNIMLKLKGRVMAPRNMKEINCI
jgi:hypothetical protein